MMLILIEGASMGRRDLVGTPHCRSQHEHILIVR